MKVPSRISLSVPRALPLPRPRPQQTRPLHQSIPRTANVAPIVGTGPPPEPPTPAVRNASERLERRRKHAELLKTAKEIRSAQEGKASPGAARRFWKEVGVREIDGALQVYLDARPLRHPHTKEIIRVPLSKPNLASALAVEWDILTSPQQATKQHLIPPHQPRLPRPRHPRRRRRTEHPRVCKDPPRHRPDRPALSRHRLAAVLGPSRRPPR
ncbi:uncharacterized protein TrAtP1_001975 [Trichoderma atroviride]|uniref:uncharacterized protein n=1 Tax=Hypocrea atroviridis TaxID=63577 RepID=UPI0033327C56|nr:hypothetical protein TrAtP1_001975 [Trichoderma atroviride]